MRCDFEQLEAGRVRCRRCNRQVNTPHPPERVFATCTVKGLGDHVAGALAAVGIKKKRGCGCGKRQSWLNRLGKKIGL